MLENVGQTFGRMLDLDVSLTQAANFAFTNFDTDLAQGLHSAGVGVLSSFLTAELADSLGIDGAARARGLAPCDPDQGPAPGPELFGDRALQLRDPKKRFAKALGLCREREGGALALAANDNRPWTDARRAA